MVTIKAVAKLAGVSTTTASCVLNNKPGVKPETMQRVLDAAQQLNYVPNALAQSFRNKRSNTLLVATCEALDEFGVFTQELVGTVLAARKHSYDVLVKSYPTHNDKYLREIYQTVAGKRADSVVLIGGGFDPLIEWFLERDVKVVLLSAFTELPVPTVNIDSSLWAGRLTEYLLAQKRTRLCYLTYYLNDREENNRADGFRSAMAAHGLPTEGRVFATGSDSIERMDEVIDQILDLQPEGVVCWNDFMATKVIDKCRLRGLRVPQDVAVTGFDDLSSEMFKPYALTTVHQSFLDLGRRSVEVLLEVMGGATLPDREVVLDCYLVVRESA